ncbi:MAG: trypsin-like peptidase domain-containing protein [Candidatus Marithrix sp.]
MVINENFLKNFFNYQLKMTKRDKCVKSCSSNSSISEVCYKVQCEPRCKKDCCIKKCPCYEPEEIVCLFKDAVVEIHSEFILLGDGITSADSSTPLAANQRADVILESNGFFIDGHYIVAPAQAVLMPPSLTSVANRYPLQDPADVELGQIKNVITQPSRILVSVFNVNGRGCGFVYEAALVGVDGSGDIAVLKIKDRDCSQWNLCNPCIEPCHPKFKFGHSRAAKEGEKVYLLGDYVAGNGQRAFNAVAALDGVVSDHRYIDYSGFALQELLLVSAGAYSHSSGLPILDCQGRVIGMQTTDLAAINDLQTRRQSEKQHEGAGFVAGPSEKFMRRVVKTIIHGKCPREFNCDLETICDPVGAFYRYLKGYLGLGYNLFSGVDYDITSDFTSGQAFAGFPRVRLDSAGNFINAPSCKRLQGLKVVSLAGLADGTSGQDNGLYFTPGGALAAPLPTGLPESSLLPFIKPGDQIVKLGGYELGDLENQIAPSLVLYRLCPGDLVEICFRRGGNSPNYEPNDATDNYEMFSTKSVCVDSVPKALDYPWYSSIFPLISESPYSFLFPANQLTNPQFPALSVAGAGKFQPAV